MALLKTVFLLGWLYISFVFNLEIIPERAELLYVNKEYVKDVALNVRKLGRRGSTVVNANFTLLYEMSNNITVDVLFFEYLHNEYKRTFVEMHFKLCDMMKDDQYMGMAVRNAGLTECPVKPGVYALCNMSIPNADQFPYLWPFERAKVTGMFSNPKTGIVVYNGSVFFTFKQNKVKKH